MIQYLFNKGTYCILDICDVNIDAAYYLHKTPDKSI